MTAGFQKHSATSRAAAEQLTTEGSMEHDIYGLLNVWTPTSKIHGGWTGDELAEYLQAPHYGYGDVQNGTIAARLRGLELKGLAVKLEETRRTRAGRQAHVWVSKIVATEHGLKLAPTAAETSPRTAYEIEMQFRMTDLSIMVARLCRRLPADDKMRQQAESYMQRHKLWGSPLRDSENVDMEGK